MQISRTLFTLAVLAIFANVPFASAQAGGGVSGIIKDPSGAVVPGVTVTLVNAALGTPFVATSDGQGAYAFPNVPVGRYDLVVNLHGFKPVRRTNLAIDINARLQVDVTLELGGQTE